MNPAQTERLRRAHARLTDAVTALTTSEGWRRMLTVAARFHNYSPHNVLLIGVQRPDATHVAGYRTWQSLGRQVRHGERGIAIIAPYTSRADARAADGAHHEPAPELLDDDGKRVLRGYRVVHVFDVSQTDGEPLPEVAPQLLTGGAPDGLWDALAGEVTAAGFALRDGNCSPANGVTDYLARTVTVRDDLPSAQRVKTLAHELAHVLLHDPAVRPADLDRGRAEVEAESVAYLVAHAHGLDSNDYTVPYVAGWAGGATGVLLATAERVMGAADRILTAAPPARPADAASTAARSLLADRAADRHRSVAPVPARRPPSLAVER